MIRRLQQRWNSLEPVKQLQYLLQTFNKALRLVVRLLEFFRKEERFATKAPGVRENASTTYIDWTTHDATLAASPSTADTRAHGLPKMYKVGRNSAVLPFFLIQSFGVIAVENS